MGTFLVRLFFVFRERHSIRYSNVISYKAFQYSTCNTSGGFYSSPSRHSLLTTDDDEEDAEGTRRRTTTCAVAGYSISFRWFFFFYCSSFHNRQRTRRGRRRNGRHFGWLSVGGGGGGDIILGSFCSSGVARVKTATPTTVMIQIPVSGEEVESQAKEEANCVTGIVSLSPSVSQSDATLLWGNNNELFTSLLIHESFCRLDTTPTPGSKSRRRRRRRTRGKPKGVKCNG